MIGKRFKAGMKAFLSVVGDEDQSQVEAKCGNCQHFDLELGQQQLAKNPTFIQVMETLEPWQLAVDKRHFKPNPAFIACRSKLGAKLDELNALERENPKDEARAPLDNEIRALQLELDDHNPEVVDEAAYKDIPAEIRNVRWDQFGACTKNYGEGRTAIDTCDLFAAAVEKPAA